MRGQALNTSSSLQETPNVRAEVTAEGQDRQVGDMRNSRIVKERGFKNKCPRLITFFFTH